MLYINNESTSGRVPLDPSSSFDDAIFCLGENHILLLLIFVCFWSTIMTAFTAYHHASHHTTSLSYFDCGRDAGRTFFVCTACFGGVVFMQFQLLQTGIVLMGLLKFPLRLMATQKNCCELQTLLYASPPGR